jgi:hypothetical protein
MSESTKKEQRILAFEGFCRTQDFLSAIGLVPLTETQYQHRRILQTFITRIEDENESSEYWDRSFYSARLHALPKGMCQSSLKRDILVVSKALKLSGHVVLYIRYILGADNFNKVLQAYGIIGPNVDNSSIPIELNYKCPGLPVLGECDASNCYKSTNNGLYNCYVGKDHQDHFGLKFGFFCCHSCYQRLYRIENNGQVSIYYYVYNIIIISIHLQQFVLTMTSISFLYSYFYNNTY